VLAPEARTPTARAGQVTFPLRASPQSQQITPLPWAIGNCCAHASSGGVRGGVSLRTYAYHVIARPFVAEQKGAPIRSRGYIFRALADADPPMHMHPPPVQRVQASCGWHRSISFPLFQGAARRQCVMWIVRTLSNVHGRPGPFIFLSIKPGLHTCICIGHADSKYRHNVCNHTKAHDIPFSDHRRKGTGEPTSTLSEDYGEGVQDLPHLTSTLDIWAWIEKQVESRDFQENWRNRSRFLVNRSAKFKILKNLKKFYKN
jgi:hypothetical protein